MTLAAVAFAGGSLLISFLLGPKRPTPEKLAPYECGIVPLEDARKSIFVRYYLVAMLFILFDMEIVFLIPWAVVFRQLTFTGSKVALFGLIEMGIFLAILILGYVYAWRKGALEWD
jgi:NADH-quinone oxidoreductase subunit A